MTTNPSNDNTPVGISVPPAKLDFEVRYLPGTNLVSLKCPDSHYRLTLSEAKTLAFALLIAIGDDE